MSDEEVANLSEPELAELYAAAELAWYALNYRKLPDRFFAWLL